MATFKILDTFDLANRGCVLVGDITSGTISAGDYISLLIDDKVLKPKILAVEMVDKINSKIANVGLLISTEDREKIKSLNLKGVEISILTD